MEPKLETINYERALDAMELFARNLMTDVKGVAVIISLREEGVPKLRSLTPSFRVVGPYQRLPSPETHGLEDRGSNYLAVAWSKICEMVRTLQPSGRDKRIPKGETGFRGGVIAYKNGVYTLVAFSGGTENEDVLISLEALRVLNLSDYLVE